MTGRVILIVAAHPDDEVLGCGATMARFAAEGAEVHTLFLADGVNARGEAAAEALGERRRMGNSAAKLLGSKPPTYFDFPDNRMDGADLLDVISVIADHSAPLRPELVLTHSPFDLNVDHRMCAQAVMTAFRPTPGQSVRSIAAYEVPSSTEWAFGTTGTAFQPNLFVDVTDHLAQKIAALRCYEAEMRPFPHPRSPEAVEALARWRGASCGVGAAEAFQILRELR